MVATRTRGLMQIGDVAERTGLSLRTVRYYEEVGLLPAAERSPGGFRLYREDAVQRLLVVKRMKPLDLSLEQVRELLDLLDRPGDDGVRDRLAGYRARLDAAVRTLEDRLVGARELAELLDVRAGR